jgi:hypothetical protein
MSRISINCDLPQYIASRPNLLWHFLDRIRIGRKSLGLQILWQLPEDAHLETKRSNQGKPESEQATRRLGFLLCLAG